MDSAWETRTEVETGCVGDVSVEIHWILTDDGARLAVTRIPPQGEGGTDQPVVLLHGTYSKRNFWISPKGIGLGPYLSKQGMDVWIPELRGHGLSPKGDDFPSITAEQQIRFDIPAIQRYVQGSTGRKTVWVAHSFGGVYLLGSLSCRWLDQAGVCGVITFGSQISMGERFLKIPPVEWLCRWLIRRIGYLPAPALGLGPEVEAAGTMIEVIGWKRLGGRWQNSDRLSYWSGFKEIRVPVACFAGAADRTDPPKGCRVMFNLLGSAEKSFTVLGKKQGFKKDYDHVGMIVSKDAQAEVWPVIAQRCKSWASR